MESEELKKQKERLIERLGVHIECKDQFAPLAARIMSTLVLTGKKGCCFDALVADLNASKSTVSTHLNNLQQSNRISYYTKCGDRKKYFIMHPDSMILKMDEMVATWEKEKDLHLQIMEYKKEINKHLPQDDDSKFELEFHTDYLLFLEQASSSIKRLREKLSTKIKED
ncbi:GbsR/MarR family transcriptional regulator [Leeuwenhoekiella sp. A16]|uniref:GbsR/MarR family transcriptional regulator n=1 Tax=unclassified Leeuwenhoekiella TaxID=2615029 RepID=UPI003A810466|tara:strand:- start:12339 stop:12845 length:507 start_codon:yes stop_codon:yes gene_type:complete